MDIVVLGGEDEVSEAVGSDSVRGNSVGNHAVCSDDMCGATARGDVLIIEFLGCEGGVGKVMLTKPFLISLFFLDIGCNEISAVRKDD